MGACLTYFSNSRQYFNVPKNKNKIIAAGVHFPRSGLGNKNSRYYWLPFSMLSHVLIVLIRVWGWRRLILTQRPWSWKIHNPCLNFGRTAYSPSTPDSYIWRKEMTTGHRIPLSMFSPSSKHLQLTLYPAKFIIIYKLNTYNEMSALWYRSVFFKPGWPILQRYYIY